MSKQNCTVNADLLAERKLASFDSEEFAIWWYGSREALYKKRAIEAKFFNDPDFQNTIHESHLSHKEYYENAVKKGVKFFKKLLALVEQEVDFDVDNPVNLDNLHYMLSLQSSCFGMAFFPQSSPFGLNYGMFLPMLFVNGDEALQKKWLKKAWYMQGCIGTYAQTEIGHGTYIRGLQTRADYDETSEEFVLNTPTLSAYKWWPGALGQTANVAVVIAQLYVKGKHCGLQSFLVPLRDEQTHEPLQGIDVGEIGPKLGFNGANNGFLGLHNVRIPRTNMLMKYAQVLPNGHFVQSPEPLMLYNVMIFVRVSIVRDAAFSLRQTATIATRYKLSYVTIV